MTWFKVDDSFWRSKKVRKLGERNRIAAIGLWTISGVWSADNLSDGFVPWVVVDQWDRRRRLASLLLEVGLWREAVQDGEMGIVFHDWDDWQPTRDQVIQRRKVDAERRARWRDARRNNAVTQSPEVPKSQKVSRRDAVRESRNGSHGESRMGSVLPDPTRPDPSLKALEETLGGVVTQVDASCTTSPKIRCKQHQHLPPDDPGQNCVACRDARLATEKHQSLTAESERKKRRAAREECQRCDAEGWLIVDGTQELVSPATRCDHRPLRSVS